MKISEMYPARTDANGLTWYRPTPQSGLMWGFTADPAQADASYEVSEEDIQEYKSQVVENKSEWEITVHDGVQRRVDSEG